MTRSCLTLAAVILLAWPGLAAAQGRLISSSPAAQATVAKPVKLTLTFSDPVVVPGSGVELVMTAMPGMADHPPMPVRGFRSRLSTDGKTLILTLPRPLPAGSYDMLWHIEGADRRKATGSYSFKVR